MPRYLHSATTTHRQPARDVPAPHHESPSLHEARRSGLKDSVQTGYGNGQLHPGASAAAAPPMLAQAAVPRYLRGAAGRDAHVAQALSTAHGDGMPLPEAQRSRFETGLQADFSDVRIHAGAAAAAAARGVQARAYTVGRDIVFGRGEFAPDQAAGRRLLAHELVHVQQQSRGGEALQREALPGATPVGLEAEDEATRRSLKFDTDQPEVINYPTYFDLAGTPITAGNVDDSFNIESPSIQKLTDDKVRSKLYAGLKNYARGVFDLWPAEEGPSAGKATTKRLNLVYVENMDLTNWGGPNAAFRFSCIGKETKGRITVRILIDELPLQTPLAAATAAKGAQDTKATPQGLTHDDTVEEALWTRVLRALAQIDGSVLGRIKDVTFTQSSANKGPKGEAAEFSDARPAGATVWTRKITMYQQMVNANDASFAFTLAHEIAHGIDDAPTQGDKGRVKGAVHDLPHFKEAAKKDGGRGSAVTDYAKTNDSEFFAECYAMYLQQPQTLKALRPHIYEWFDGFAHPNTTVSPYSNDLAGHAEGAAGRKLELYAPYAPEF